MLILSSQMHVREKHICMLRYSLIVLQTQSQHTLVLPFPANHPLERSIYTRFALTVRLHNDIDSKHVCASFHTPMNRLVVRWMFNRITILFPPGQFSHVYSAKRNCGIYIYCVDNTVFCTLYHVTCH